MDKVKKIQAWIDNRLGVPNTFNIQSLTDFLAFARRQLFPKSPDNPDGYKPKQNPGTKGYHDVMEFYQDEPKPDEGGLIDWKSMTPIIDGYTYYDSYGEAVAKAQRDLTASILKADCQKGIEGILDEIAEDFVAVVGNLYMTDANMTLAFELWGQVKKQILKKGVKR